MQKIESTLENKLRQKDSIFNSSSTVFWCIANKEKKIDTTISFLNHFLLKRKIDSVSMRLSLRTMSGKLISETIEEINKPKVYAYSMLKLLEKSSITEGEFSAYIEFTSSSNLGVPFCAVTSEIVSQKTFDLVHTYGRALECSEFGSKIDFKTSYETGWCIWNFGSEFLNHFVFHNGRLHSDTSFELKILKNGKELTKLNIIRKKFNPFESIRITLEEEIQKDPNSKIIFDKIANSNIGDIDIKIKIEGVKSTFPRLLFVCTKHSDSQIKAIDDLDKINFTHSNFDFDNAIQPKSCEKYGFINNPKYPSGVKSGFRFYPCNELITINIDGFNKSNLPLDIDAHKSLRVSSELPIPSRLVGSNWSIWSKKDFIKDCSTGTYIIEYLQNPGFWHWGRLIPRGKDISSILTLMNPFADDKDEFIFTIKIFNESGKCFEKNIKFNGPNFYLEFDSNLDFINEDGCWYSVVGEGVSKFNIFSTSYFDNLEDGTIEHSF